jgi:DDE superfamily endonuclease
MASQVCEYWQAVDAVLGDIPEVVERERPYYTQPRFRRINDFYNDDQAVCKTAFTKDELRHLMGLFGLNEMIRVPRADGKYDSFHPEELFLFTLMKMREGGSNAAIVEDQVGGRSTARWGRGYNYLVKYLDERYLPILGHEGLQRWVAHFPEFAEKIRERVGRDDHCFDHDGNYHHTNHGVHFQPDDFGIAGFVDCKDYRMLRPHSGPDGHFPGAMRRPNWNMIQRAFFTRFGKKHALRVLTICLPNGLTGAVYGPMSARHHDTTLLAWSGFDQYLVHVQQGQPCQYLFYGDSAFRGHWNCVRSRHEPTVNAPALTQQQHDENTAMRRAREGIEWSFGLLTNLWKLASIRDRFKLETNEATVMAQVRVMHLLTNCYTCIHGNNISSDHSFACKPPELEAYLTL